MSNIEKAAQVITEHWNGMHTNESLGRQRMLAQALADAGLLAPENTRTEWGVRFSEQYIDVAPSEQAAREKASYIGRPVMRRTVTSAVTEWEVAP